MHPPMKFFQKRNSILIKINGNFYNVIVNLIGKLKTPKNFNLI